MVKRNWSVVMLIATLGCGSSGGTPADAGPDAAVANGTHYHYVVNKIRIAQNSTQATQYGLDLGSPSSNAPDGTVDNKLSLALGTLDGMGAGGDAQSSTDASVMNGGVLLLADLQTGDFTASDAAGFRTLVGANPMPAPPAHLGGSGTFGISSSSPDNSPIVGSIAAGTLNGGPGPLVVQFALADVNGVNHVVQLNLVAARVRASNLSSSKIGDATSGGAVLAGAITSSEMDAQFLTALAAVYQTTINRDCSSCPTCTQNSSGAYLRMQVGCTPNPASIKASLIGTLLEPDVCTTSSCTSPDALSFGLGITAVPGMFAP